MQVDHLEVAPRLWDKTFAVNLKKKEPEQPKEENTVQERMDPETASVVGVVALSTFDRIKQYLIPGIFIVALFIVAYVIWKYFTKYRKAKENTVDSEGEEKKDNPNKIHPAKLIASIDDIDKYIVDSDDEDNKYDADDSEEESDNESEEEESRVEEIIDDAPSFEFKDTIIDDTNLFSSDMDNFDSILSPSDQLNDLPNIPEDLPLLETDSEDEEPKPKPSVRKTRKVVV